MLFAELLGFPTAGSTWTPNMPFTVENSHLKSNNDLWSYAEKSVIPRMKLSTNSWGIGMNYPWMLSTSSLLYTNTYLRDDYTSLWLKKIWLKWNFEIVIIDSVVACIEYYDEDSISPKTLIFKGTNELGSVWSSFGPVIYRDVMNNKTLWPVKGNENLLYGRPFDCSVKFTMFL